MKFSSANEIIMKVSSVQARMKIFKIWVLRVVSGPFPEGPARQIDVSRQKLSPHCLEAIFDSQLPSQPNCLLKCLPNCLSPTREGFLSSFKINPAVRVIARQVRDKICLAAIFAPRHQSVSSGPLGSGPKSQNSHKNGLLGGLQKGPAKYPKESKNSARSLKIGLFGLFRVFWGTFLQTAQRPFLRLFCDFGPGGPGDSCKWRLGT